MGRPDATDTEVREAQLGHKPRQFYQSTSDKYDTIGEKGIKLSEGKGSRWLLRDYVKKFIILYWMRLYRLSTLKMRRSYKRL